MVFSQHILVRMHPPLRNAVRAAADRAGLSVSELVRRTLHREIADPVAKDMPSSTAIQPMGTRARTGIGGADLRCSCAGSDTA